MEKVTPNNGLPTVQHYDQYTEEDFLVWKTLYQRQADILSDIVNTEFVDGVHAINFSKERIPEFNATNALLADMTGWQIYPVPGIVDDEIFFRLLSERQFPATTWLRSYKNLDYLEEPDMFHDVFGHVPLLTNQPFVDFLQQLSEIGLEYLGQEWPIHLLSRIYWYTVEFGLIREQEKLKIYGAGILSSAGESKYSVSNEPEHFPFDVDAILDSPYRKDTFQTRYFIIDDLSQLYESLPAVREGIRARLKK